MKRMFFLLLLLVNYIADGQHRATFVIDTMPQKSNATTFLAGNFNMWNPGDSSYIFKVADGKRILSISLTDGHYEYKVTRGNWQTGEENTDFKPIGNRVLDLNSDTTIHLKIGAWADGRPRESKNTFRTATAQVHILDSAFYIPQLKRYRRIWIYLPNEYQTSKKKYPVIYMQDGQNVFDASTSYSGEWGVDEFLDSVKGNCKEVIVVAVDNGLAKRMNEYNPWKFMKFGKGEGNEYVDFLVKALKPFIDKHYRTLKNKGNTSIAGSSMGGLISLYAVLKYPKTFGSAGIFSPAFWTATGMDSVARKTDSGIDSATFHGAKKMKSKLFFYAGGKEGESMVPDMLRIEEIIKEKSKSPIKSIVDPEAKHNESAWRKHFPEFFKWVFCEN